MSQRGTDRTPRLIGAAMAGIVLGASLSGCSNPDIYFDRRETLALSAGDAIEANRAEQMVDPWPAVSGNRNIGFNGEKMQGAAERYRTNRVIPPINATTSAVPAAPAAAAESSSPAGSSTTTSTSTTTSASTQ